MLATFLHLINLYWFYRSNIYTCLTTHASRAPQCITSPYTYATLIYTCIILAYFRSFCLRAYKPTHTMHAWMDGWIVYHSVDTFVIKFHMIRCSDEPSACTFILDACAFPWSAGIELESHINVKPHVTFTRMACMRHAVREARSALYGRF